MPHQRPVMAQGAHRSDVFVVIPEFHHSSFPVRTHLMFPLCSVICTKGTGEPENWLQPPA